MTSPRLKVLAVSGVTPQFGWPEPFGHTSTVEVPVGGSVAGEQLRTNGNELFCEKGQDLLSYVVARNSSDSKDREMAGCQVLRRGLHYTVLENANPEGKGIIKVRIRRSRGNTDGYMMTNIN